MWVRSLFQFPDVHIPFSDKMTDPSYGVMDPSTFADAAVPGRFFPVSSSPDVSGITPCN